jgi:hypothetical protein
MRALPLALLAGCAGEAGDTGLDLAAASGTYALTLDGEAADTVSISFSADGTEVVTSFGDGARGDLDGRTFRVAFEDTWSVLQYVDGQNETSEHVETLVYEATFVDSARFEGVHTSEATCEGIHCEEGDAWSLETYTLVGVQQ